MRMGATKKKTAARATEDVIIPDKLYFRIGEVAELSQLPSYVLRFWETEFPQLKPTKSSTGQRMYRRRDVESVLYIKKLLYEDGYTIAGAREKLKAEAKPARAQGALPFAAPRSPRVELKRIRHNLLELLEMLKTSPQKRK
ncbi:MAG TPA: MerR family transcriptional regulator [Clostridia bacterium]|nr:MerR family transcriptional regulator [Clostridia bacterium]